MEATTGEGQVLDRGKIYDQMHEQLMLNIATADDIKKLEDVVERGKLRFIEVGAALLRIRDARLYKQRGFSTFDAYCKKQWGWGSNYANKQIRASEIAVGVAEVGGEVPSERVARELAALPTAAEQKAAIDEAAAAAGGEPTTGSVAEAVRGRTRQTMVSSDSNEWYTPEEYTKAASKVMSGIDLDPASCEEANNIVKATHFFTKKQDGLKRKWFGSVFANPPYGKTDSGKSNQALWLDKLIHEYSTGNVEEAIFLCNAVTGTAWFQKLWAQPLCFPRRIRFVAPAALGKKDQPINSSVLVYFGSRVGKFIDTFADLGQIVVPESERHAIALGEDVAD